VGYGLGAFSQSWILEDAHWTVPQDGRGRGDDVGERNASVGPNVEALVTVRNVFAELGYLIGAATGTKGNAEWKGNRVSRDDNLSGFQQRRARLEITSVEERSTNGAPLRHFEGVSHAATDNDGVGLFAQDLHNCQFVLHFGTTDNRHKRACGALEQGLQRCYFLQQIWSSGTGNQRRRNHD